MFDWVDYLGLAHEMVTQGEPSGAPEESRLRCAVSRAYYAAFGRAKVYLSDLYGPGKLPQTADVHEYVISQFRDDSDDQVWRAIGADLERLREYRNMADYRENAHGWTAKATASLVYGKRAVQGVEGLGLRP